jgi:hypothetical protein
MTSTSDLRNLAADIRTSSWHVSLVDDGSHSVFADGGILVAETYSRQRAAFIAAANPATVIALLDRIAELERALLHACDWIEDAADDLSRHRPTLGMLRDAEKWRELADGTAPADKERP